MLVKKNTIVQIIIVLVICIFIVSLIILSRHTEERRIENDYTLAITEYETNELISALNLFLELKDYKESNEYIELISIKLRNEMLSLVENDVESQELEDYLNTIKWKSEFKNIYDEILEMKWDKKEKLHEEQEKKFIASLKNTPPYKGLEERYIQYTSWGKPTNIEYEQFYEDKVESRRSKFYSWTTYKDGKISSHKYLIVTQGKVSSDPVSR